MAKASRPEAKLGLVDHDEEEDVLRGEAKESLRDRDIGEKPEVPWPFRYRSANLALVLCALPLLEGLAEEGPLS